ncbi:hypothetical protein MHIB_13220 [Mycolicibacter hiberniae]|uniref:Uncharacterized protein n=1 Tax=Mycolicibacter hiberniae TaxID=29314 RepID=A0A7I7WZI3_9MYCO|nr:hypothetical protein MHIB_13220 [Mycolicibacter hiberniae]
MSGPTFIAVVPAEVDRYGAAAAILLAHIRYRTVSDGPGRIERGGCRWWRVPLRALAAETGLSVKAVRTGLKALDGVVLAKQFPPLSDQSLAYRMASVDDALTGQLPAGARPDLPVAPAGNPVAAAGTDRAPAGTTPCPSGHLYLSSETFGEGGEGGRRDTSPRPVNGDRPAANSEPATADPDQFGDDSPEDQPVADAAPATAEPPSTPDEIAAAAKLPPPPMNGPQSFTEPEPSRYCPKHPGGTSGSCPDCRDARRCREVWDQRRRGFNAALRAARDAWIAACRECEDNDADGRCGGWVLDPWDELPDPIRCGHPRLLQAYAARHPDFTIPSRAAS